MKVKSWMTSNLITVTPDTGVIDAFLLLKEDNISQLPVVRDGKPVGIITYQKLLYLPVGKTVRLPHNTYKIYILNANLSVSGFMTSPPVTIQENSPLESASLMLHNKKNQWTASNFNRRKTCRNYNCDRCAQSFYRHFETR